ncbi:MAG: Ig-like domain-containing protein, partial [Actinomycetota bacterium]
GTGSGYLAQSGTSMAAPFVTGVALLMRQAAPGLSPGEVKAAMTGTAVDWGRGGDGAVPGSAGPDVDYGAGRLDAHAALGAVGAAVGAAPAVPAHRTREGTVAAAGAAVEFPIDVVDTAVPLAATLLSPEPGGPDVDLSLLDPSGVEVAASRTAGRHEDLGVTPAAAGRYRLRVTSAQGAGGFVLDVSAGLADAAPPAVVAVSPADGAAGVPVDATVTARFSEPMDRAATEAAASLTGPGGTRVAVAFTWTGDELAMRPAAALAHSATYTARIAATAADASGLELPAERTWTFTTAAAPARTLPPAAVDVEVGTLRLGGVASLAARDAGALEVDGATTGTSTSSWVARFPGVPAAPASLSVTWAGASATGCTQTISLYRWEDGVWERLDSRAIGAATTTLTDLASRHPAQHVGPAGEVLVRVRCSSAAAGAASATDLLTLTYRAP